MIWFVYAKKEKERKRTKRKKKNKKLPELVSDYSTIAGYMWIYKSQFLL